MTEMFQRKKNRWGRAHVYDKRVFLFCHNVWPSRCVTILWFCHNAWWCWRNLPKFIY